jgi:hypothetical protein
MRNYLISILVIIAFDRCARQTSPSGGLQDKKHPVLEVAKPKNGEKNFSGEKLEFTFDEYIKLKDPSTEILITPSVGKETKFLVKKNKLTIIPKKKLSENTTYSIAFRDALQDITEGNILPNFRHAFSTGPIIDSLQLKGTVFQVFSSEAPENIVVALYQSDTFNIFKHQPTYFSQTNKKGVFNISNLKPGEYNIYAFDDKSKNLKVESKTERFGYLSKKIILTGKVDSIRLPLMRVDARPIKITSIRHTQHISKIRFTKQIDSIKIKSEYANYFTYQFGDMQDEIQFYGKLKEQPTEDSLKIELSVKDSIGNTFDTVTYLKSIKIKVPKEPFKIQLPPSAYNPENKQLTLTANFNKPLAFINTDSIYVQIDSTNFQLITKKDFKVDTLHHQLTLKTILQLKEPGLQGVSVNPILVLGKGAFVSMELDSSKGKSERIRIPKEDQFGSLSIDIATNEKNYIVQLLSGRDEIIRTEMNIKKFTYNHLDPQEFKIRIIIDQNNNHRWDPGNIDKHIDPERVVNYKSFDGKTSIPIRANWEVGPLLIKF